MHADRFSSRQQSVDMLCSTITHWNLVKQKPDSSAFSFIRGAIHWRVPFTKPKNSEVIVLFGRQFWFPFNESAPQWRIQEARKSSGGDRTPSALESSNTKPKVLPSRSWPCRKIPPIPGITLGTPHVQLCKFMLKLGGYISGWPLKYSCVFALLHFGPQNRTSSVELCDYCNVTTTYPLVPHIHFILLPAENQAGLWPAIKIASFCSCKPIMAGRYLQEEAACTVIGPLS